MMSKLYLVASLLVLSPCATATLTNGEKTGILKKHNDLRAAIAKPCTAADMETLAWDDTLAAESQAWADKCVGDHDPDASVKFGENLWMLTSASTYESKDIVGAVQEWYDEIKDVKWIKDASGAYSEAKSKAGTAGCASPDAANGNCFIGHFTQVVWAKSNKIGCGVKKCEPMTVSGQKYPKGALLVCRYTSPGNSAAKQGSPNHVTMPFIAGKKCATCAGKCSVAGLCDTGSTPNRCADQAAPIKFNGVDYKDCKSYVEPISVMNSKTGDAACTMASMEGMIKGVCDKYCKLCTASAGVGTCGASSGGVAFSGAPIKKNETSGGNTTTGAGGKGAGKSTVGGPRQGEASNAFRTISLLPFFAVLAAFFLHRE